MVRKWLLACVATGCLFGASSALADARLSASDTPVTPFYGNINPFYGNIDPFYGNIQPFYGNINPFYGTINPFYGTINPFYGNISPFWGDTTQFWGTINPFYGTIQPFYGNINPFWGNITPFAGPNAPFYGTIQPFWQSAGPLWGSLNATWTQLQTSNGTDFSGVQSQLNDFIGQSAAFWGPAVQKATKKNFMDGFAAQMFAKYGIDPTNPASLATVSAATRSEFFLNWYDGLMSFAGTDHVDWWMGAVHWSPQLTQIQGLGTNSVIGVLDAYFTKDNSGVQNLDFAGGYKTYVNDHGAAVASLIAAKHDGQDVMGIAPNSKIELYNPFDQSGTASWADVQAGIVSLNNKGATVINASLGVPGWTLSSEWSSILTSPSLFNVRHGLVLVKAAGNEGVAQSTDIAWAGNQAPNNLLVVGSVDPNGNLSTFSNTPGEACILVGGVCKEENKLKYRFLVAPGELILVSDNNGGVTRMTGTSFAAPLVTGAVALLQDRWPWLQQHAEETVQIILQSADDLGAPGVDPVYGWGELDVQASQSPLNFNNLVVYQPSSSGGQSLLGGVLGGLLGGSPTAPLWSASSLKAAVLKPGQLNLWQQQGAYLVAFEAIGTTYRDFDIPLSSLLVGKTMKGPAGDNPFQSYLYQRLIDWAGGANTTSFNSRSVPLSEGDWNVSMLTTQSSPDEVRSGAGPFHSEFVAENRDSGIALRLGEGNGAHALVGQAGFSLSTDYDPATGGVNPVLGFASGGAYASGTFAIGHDAHLSVGFSQKSDDHTYIDPTFGLLQDLPLAPNKASASVMGLDYTVAKGLTLNTSYTHLDEASGLLGAQGSGVLSLSGGAQTNATTLGITAAFADGWKLSGSATAAHTAANPSNGALTLSKAGLESTAYELVASKSGLFAELDQLRISFAQPLHVESGALQYQSLQVVDRQTGGLGAVTQAWNIAGNREYRVETLYRMPLLEGRAEVDGFGLLDINPPTLDGRSLSVSVGAQFRIGL